MLAVCNFLVEVSAVGRQWNQMLDVFVGGEVGVDPVGKRDL